MKKKALVLAICMAISAPAVCAAQILPDNSAGLNLGDIQSSSFLGQTFQGEIPILFSNAVDAKELQVRLAPNHIFQKIGVEYLPFLRDLKFIIGTRGNKPVISVRSSRPIEMPFLSFVLEVAGPQGLIYQDYTILIDPKNNQSAPASEPIQEFRAQAIALKAKIQPQPVVIQKTTSKVKRGMMLKYEVLEGDTLTDIAGALKTSQVSLKRMINIIHRANPKAFVNNDIRQLKNNVFLKIPSANQLKNFSFAAATKTITKAKSQPDQKTEQNNIKVEKESTVVTSESVASYKIKKGDTLSAITQKFSHNGISFTKRMHAIHKANPQAFSKNKINLLKIGEVLNIPYLEEMNEEFNEETEKEFIVDHNAKMPASSTSSSAAKVTKVEAEKVTAPSIQKAEKSTKPSVDTTTVEMEESGLEASTQEVAIKSSVVEKNATNSNTTINNLEKRIRELRKNLLDSRSKLSRLETILVTKDQEIKKRNRKIETLTAQLSEVEGLAYDSEPITETDDSLENIIESNNTAEEEVSQSDEVVTPMTVKLDELSANTGLSPLQVAENISQFLKSHSINDYSLGFLALLLGLGLITYRKQLYSYISVSGDYPSYYPREKDQIFAQAEVSDESKIEITTRIDDENEISEATLEECDQLINELSSELENQESTTTETNDKEWDNLEKICDEYIDKFKEPEFDDVEIDTEIDTDVTEDQSEDVSFEDMVTNLVDNLDEKSKFANNNPNPNPDPEDVHDFGILIDRKQEKLGNSNVIDWVEE